MACTGRGVFSLKTVSAACFLLVVCTFAHASFSHPQQSMNSPRVPVILVPPLAGGKMDVEARDKDTVPFAWCKRTFARTSGWLNYFSLLPGFARCWADNMRLVCNSHGTICNSPQGVMVQPSQEPSALLTVDPLGYFPVFKPLVASLEGYGYVLGQSLLLHSYDTRQTPLAHTLPSGGSSFMSLKSAVEQAVASQGAPAVIVGAGLGAKYASLFLDSAVDANWTQQHVQSFISVSGVWGGAPYYMLGMLSGIWGGWERYLGKDVIRTLAQGTPALQWLLPTTQAFGNNTLFQNVALNTSYTAAGLPKMLHTADAPQAADVLQSLKTRPHILAAPIPRAVPHVHCIYGTQIPTPLRAKFDSADFADDKVDVVLSDGDGVVPLESLSLCRNWVDDQEEGQQVSVVEFPQSRHHHLLTAYPGIGYVVKVVTKLNNLGTAEIK